MFERVRHALMRLGEPRLQKAVGAEVVKYMSLLNEPISATRLADVLIERLGGEIISDANRQLRHDLLAALPKLEAQALEEFVAGHPSDDPWGAISNLDFTDGTRNGDLLGEFFAIPRPIMQEITAPVPALERICGAYPLYSYQAQTIENALRKLRTDEARVLIHMPTGAGKTRLAMVLISRVLRESPARHVVVWLAHSEELCEQAAEEFKKCWSVIGERELEIGRYWGEYDCDLSLFEDGLIVASLAKLYGRSLRQQEAFLSLKRRTRLVIMDEAHQAIAPTYQHLLQMLAPKGGGTGLLGLSATPGRSWLDLAQDQELADFFSRQKVTLETTAGLDPITFLQTEGYLAVPEYRFVKYQPSIQLSAKEQQALAEGLDISVDILKKLGDEVQRNLLIIREILEQVSLNSQVLVFACSVNHAETLADTLVVKGVRASAVSTRTTLGRRREIIESFRQGGNDNIQVLVNFAILTTGFDAPRTNVVVIARPTQSVVLYSQMIGRAMRGPRSGGNQHCTIVTVKDQLPGFRSIYEGFTHWEDVWE